MAALDGQSSDFHHLRLVLDIYKALRQIGSANIEEFDTDGGRLVFEKFHPYLPVALLKADAFSCRIDFSALPQMCDMLLQQQGD